ncbi:MAG: recombinase family protein [Planctomycetes bacterium]|nr:recombinase family protein [Planctomycetota bacterium]
MSRAKTNDSRRAATTLRCAIYTRKSTDEGLDREFNSLDAQRESGEAYIKSQAQEGWVCLPEHYNDGGFTGGNMERPALRRLLADIDAGRIDIVIVYKVDRLSRSLMDFAKMMETFDRHNVSFVSVTQQFNTTHSMGRLTLNILLSFAQFEREIISERTRDKIAAARRKGKWSGGHPILGYDVVDRKLVINKAEASRVRQIFEMYLEFQALIPTIAELDRRGWKTKRWTIRKGGERGGRPFDRGRLHVFLTNVAYVGKVRYKDEVHEGEHQGIVDPDVFERVQALLRRNHRTGGAEARNQFGALLKGILRCVACNCSMTPAHTKKGESRRYRYYVCLQAQKRGWKNCPSQSVPAAEIEQFVVDQIRCIGRDPGLVAATLAQTRTEAERRIVELEREADGHERDLERYHAEIRGLVAEPGVGSSRISSRLADLQERIRLAEQRATEIGSEVDGLRRHMIDEDDVAQALAAFDPVWDSLTLREQSRLLHLLIERVDYDGRTDDISITFHPTGIETLAAELAEKQESVA